MTRQRQLRWAVAAAGLGMAVLLYVQTRERPATERPAVATPSDPEAAIQSGAGVDTRFRSGAVEFEMAYERLLQYPEDNRTVWIKGRFRVDDGTMLAADEIESSGPPIDGEPAQLLLRGNVQLDTAEGASIRAQQATYTNATGVAILPGPVTFARGRISGSGTNGEYHRDTGVFTVSADAKVTTQAGEGADQVDATAQSMTFNRATQALLFDVDARIAHAKQTMTAQRATLYLSEGQDQFRVIELRGQSRVVPMPGHEADVPDMRGNDIDLAFYEGTQVLERGVLVGGAEMVIVENGGPRSIAAATIDFATASDGRTLTNLQARDRVVVRTPASGQVPARTITAAALVATGREGAGLTAAIFNGGVTFVERTAAGAGREATERTGSSQVLSMKLGGNLDDVEEAQFQQNVRFRAGDVTGDADVGNYIAAKGQLNLRPAAKPVRLPRVESGRVTVDAREFIDIDLDTEDLHGRGDVKTVNTGQGKPGAAERDTALFNDRETMYGFGTEFWYDGRTRRARYAGTPAEPARLTQGDSMVAGENVELIDETQDLNASGSVESTMVVVAEETKRKTSYHVRADTLAYRDGARTATYTGKIVTLTGPDGVITARSMVMTLEDDSRELEQLDARTDVHSVLTDGREALAETLLYQASESRYTLRGRPLVLRAPTEDPGVCSLARGRMVYFTAGSGIPVFPPEENAGPVERRNVACTGALQQ